LTGPLPIDGLDGGVAPEEGVPLEDGEFDVLQAARTARSTTSGRARRLR